jgi:hypothetical protein
VIVTASCGLEPGRVVKYKPLLDAAIAIPHFSKYKAATGTASHQVDKASTQVAQVQSAPPEATAMPAQAVAKPQPAVQTVPENQSVHSFQQPVHSAEPKAPARSTEPAITAPVTTPVGNATAPVQTQVAPAAVSAGPSQEDIQKVQESLMQTHARADAIRGSVDTLRRQQAAEGLNLSPEISGAVSRLDQYLQAADRAAQSNDLSAALRNIENAEKQLTVLEAKFGR